MITKPAESEAAMEILNCPHCNDHAQGVKDGDVFYVECASPTCKATGPRATNEEESIREWNYTRLRIDCCEAVLDAAEGVLKNR